jgi:hypothetical protein
MLEKQKMVAECCIGADNDRHGALGVLPIIDSSMLCFWQTIHFGSFEHIQNANSIEEILINCFRCCGADGGVVSEQQCGWTIIWLQSYLVFSQTSHEIFSKVASLLYHIV